MELTQRLREMRIRHLPLPEPIVLDENDAIETLIQRLAEGNRGCVLIERDGALHGLVSERDILCKVVEKKLPQDEPISTIMSTELRTLSPDDALERAVTTMTEGGYRNIPLVDEHRRILGAVSARDIIDYIAEHFPAEVFNLPPRLDQKMVSKEGA